MRKIGIDKTLTYKNIPRDQDGWVNAKNYMPADFDLCLLKITNKPIIAGWSNGLSWDGLKIKKTDEVLKWKDKRDQREIKCQ
jgi:hypothetical protein